MVGIVGYGVYIPVYRIKTEMIANMWGRDINSVKSGLLIDEKSVPSADEDTVTMGVEASLNALRMAKINPEQIGAVYSGSESPAYAVKPNMGIISNAIGMSRNHTGADVEFACKAGTAAIQMGMGLVKSGMVKYALAVGADTAEYDVENVGDHSTGAGSGAYILGNSKEEIIADIEDTVSYTSDVPDFWRRPRMRYPTHAERFTGEPAYFSHTIEASKMIMKKHGISPKDIDHVVFHTPNGKFAVKAAKALGFSNDQLKSGFVVNKIGNTYSAATLIGLASVLDVAEPGQRIMATSFGSGAGSDSFLIRVTEKIKGRVRLAKTVQEYIERKEYIDYANYCKFTERIE